MTESIGNQSFTSSLHLCFTKRWPMSLATVMSTPWHMLEFGVKTVDDKRHLKMGACLWFWKSWCLHFRSYWHVSSKGGQEIHQECRIVGILNLGPGKGTKFINKNHIFGKQTEQNDLHRVKCLLQKHQARSNLGVDDTLWDVHKAERARRLADDKFMVLKSPVKFPNMRNT